MTRAWSLDEIAGITGGLAIGEAVITSVVVDSRQVSPGALFVALRGERADGHEFVANAFAAGATAAMVEPGRLPDGAPGVEVADPVGALGAMAIRRRGELTAPVIAVTGSSGKTTTKDFIAAVLGPGCHAAPRSFNNEIGVPLTVLAVPDEASAIVLEVGSRGPGHITALGPMIRPDVAVITNIGPAHLEMFGDLDTVRRSKRELIELLSGDGVAVVPVGDPALVAGWDGARLTFGEGSGADIAVDGLTTDTRGRSAFDLVHAGHRVRVSLPVPGRHQATNAAAAVSAALAIGEDFVGAAGRLDAVRLSPWRMEVVERTVPGGSITVVNDAYNANPDSMEAALTTVASMPGRHLAVLGMMHELGSASPDLHRQVGRRAAELGFHVVVVGEDPGIAAGAGNGTVTVADVTAARAVLEADLRPGDVVLIKASRATGLETLAQNIGGAP